VATIQIKRSAATDAPTSLEEGEPAISESSGKFFVGTSTGVKQFGNMMRILTQSEYDALSEKDDRVLYIVVG
jgi:hypothetical protein